MSIKIIFHIPYCPKLKLPNIKQNLHYVQFEEKNIKDINNYIDNIPWPVNIRWDQSGIQAYRPIKEIGIQQDNEWIQGNYKGIQFTPLYPLFSNEENFKNKILNYLYGYNTYHLNEFIQNTLSYQQEIYTLPIESKYICIPEYICSYVIYKETGCLWIKNEKPSILFISDKKQLNLDYIKLSINNRLEDLLEMYERDKNYSLLFPNPLKNLGNIFQKLNNININQELDHYYSEKNTNIIQEYPELQGYIKGISNYSKILINIHILQNHPLPIGNKDPLGLYKLIKENIELILQYNLKVTEELLGNVYEFWIHHLTKYFKKNYKYFNAWKLSPEEFISFRLIKIPTKELKRMNNLIKKNPDKIQSELEKKLDIDLNHSLEDWVKIINIMDNHKGTIYLIRQHLQLWEKYFDLKKILSY